LGNVQEGVLRPGGALGRKNGGKFVCEDDRRSEAIQDAKKCMFTRAAQRADAARKTAPNEESTTSTNRQ